MNFYDLPRRLWWSHHLAMLLHDHLIQTLVEGEEAELFCIDFNLSPVEVDSFQKLGEGEVVDWLNANGRQEHAKDVMERTVVFFILSDMCQFVFESLEAAAKGKVAVAFALLRKPFRDQLFLLEWLLSDRDHFLQEFGVGPRQIDVSTLLTTKADWMKSIVQSAADLSQYGNLGNSDMIYELRYAKEVPWSLEGDWNKALHLVTTQKNYTTAIEDLNFAVRDEEQRHELLNRYYSRVPSVLLHLSSVIQAVVTRWNQKFEPFGRLFGLRVVANLELSVAETCPDTFESFGQNGLNELVRELNLNCGECQKQLQVSSRADLEHFVRDLLVRCSLCGHFDNQLGILELAENVDTEVEE